MRRSPTLNNESPYSYTRPGSVGCTVRMAWWFENALPPTTIQQHSQMVASTQTARQPLLLMPLGQNGVCGSAVTPTATMTPMHTTAHRINATRIHSECLPSACGCGRRGCVTACTRAGVAWALGGAWSVDGGGGIISNRRARRAPPKYARARLPRPRRTPARRGAPTLFFSTKTSKYRGRAAEHAG